MVNVRVRLMSCLSHYLIARSHHHPSQLFCWHISHFQDYSFGPCRPTGPAAVDGVLLLHVWASVCVIYDKTCREKWRKIIFKTSMWSTVCVSALLVSYYTLYCTLYSVWTSAVWRQGRAGQGRAGQDRAGQGRAGQGKAGTN